MLNSRTHSGLVEEIGSSKVIRPWVGMKMRAERRKERKKWKDKGHFSTFMLPRLKHVERNGSNTHTFCTINCWFLPNSSKFFFLVDQNCIQVKCF